MLKSLFTLLAFVAGQALALALYALWPTHPLGLWLFVGYVGTFVLLRAFSLSDRLRFRALEVRDGGRILAMLLLALGLALFFTPFDLEDESVLRQFHQVLASPWGVLAVCVIGPLIEEMLFRGGVQQHLKQAGLSRWLAILVSSIAFAAVHGNVMQALPSFLLGIVLGYLYEQRGYTVSVLAHMGNNALGLLTLIYAKNLDFIEHLPTSLLLLLGATLAALGIGWTYRLIKIS